MQHENFSQRKRKRDPETYQTHMKHINKRSKSQQTLKHLLHDQKYDEIEELLDDDEFYQKHY